MARNKAKRESQNQGISRRALLASGGLGVLGSGLLGGGFISSTALGTTGPATPNGGTAAPAFQKKPVVLARAGSKDPVELARAELLFWNDIMMEHSLFMAILMPTADVATHRRSAIEFQNAFSGRLAKLRRAPLERSSLASVIVQNNDLVKRLHEFKLRAREAQLAGRIHSLVWPLFFTHTAREAERFTKRLDNLSRGIVELDPTEVVDFWVSTMGEHAQFIAHLLDPQEQALIEKANATAKAFFAARSSTPASLEPLASEIINFKEAAEDGIVSGQIKSIILPALADHVRREAVKCADELKRV